MQSRRHPVTPTDIDNILIVEDDLDLIEVLKALIIDLFPNSKIKTATNIEDAISLLSSAHLRTKSAPYDLVLADIFLKGPGTGIDILRLCRRIYPDLRILLTSAMPRDQLERIFAGEFVPRDYLEKPFSLERCREKIVSTVFSN